LTHLAGIGGGAQRPQCGLAIPGEAGGRVVHHTAIVVLHAESGLCFRAGLLKVGHHRGLNVGTHHLNIGIALVAILLVEKAQGVHQLVDRSAVGSQAAGRLQVHLLATTQASDAAPTSGLSTSNRYVVLFGGPGLKTHTGSGVVFLEKVNELYIFHYY